MKIIWIFPLFLQLHFLIPEGLLQISQLFHVPLGVHLAITAVHDPHLLLLHEHALLHVGLLQLLSQSKALIDVYGQLNLDFLGLGHFDVSFQLLNEPVFLLHLQFQISVVLLQLAHNEALRKVVAWTTCLCSWSSLRRGVWLRHRLLKPYRQFLKFFVSAVQFSLDLLQFCLQSCVLIFCNVICNF